MGLLKSHRYLIALGIGMLLIYALTRLLTLTQLPIFTDEAIYIRWAQIAKNDANWRFISLTDGKQPLFVWIVMVVMRFFSDPLIAGRIVSVLAGLGSIIGLFLLGREIFKNTWIGIVTSLLYVVYPFALVYDRMALYDSLVGTTAVWGLYLTVLLIKRLQVQYAFLLGFAAGLAVLNKSSGFFILYLLPFSLLLLKTTSKKLPKTLLRLGGFVLIVVVITYAMYFILRLSPFFYIIDEKNAVFVYPLKEWLTHPLEYVLSNLRGLSEWFLRYFGIPFFLLTILSFIDRQFLKEKLLLVLWFALPFIALALFGKTIYPRYIFFMTLSLLPLVSYTFYTLWQKYKSPLNRFLLAFFVLSYPLFLSFQILTDFENSFAPQSDKGQYLNSWASGIGIKESISFLEQQARSEKITVFTAGTFGLLPYAYEAYLIDNPQITIKGFWPVEEQIPEEILTTSSLEKTFIVFYQDCPPCVQTGMAPASWSLEKVFQMQRNEKDSFFTVYEVRTQ